ncbi:MAG TPA: hypothetical protein VFD43_04160, partial [Planctomycetota bacterium]|nr:hypothetical protein [Planctomycetota bacterium]
RRSERTQVPGTRSRQCGAALIVAMLVFALATALVVAMKGEFSRFYERSANVRLERRRPTWPPRSPR